MFTKSRTEIKLDAEINSLLDKLESMPDKKSEEYEQLLERIAKLHKLKTEERPKQISPDTVLNVAATIFGILWLARYERENVIKSRSALGLAMRPIR